MRNIVVVALTLCLIFAPASNCLAQGISEQTLMATYAYKLSKLVHWPPEKTPPMICVLTDTQDETVSKTLTSLLKKEGSGSVLKVVSSVSQVSSCNMLFVDSSQEKNLDRIIIEATKNSIVTISNINGFAQRGGMFAIDFTLSRTVKMKVNYPNVKGQGVSVDAGLLAMLEQVG